MASKRKAASRGTTAKAAKSARRQPYDIEHKDAANAVVGDPPLNMNATNAQTCHLLNIPTELLETIASYILPKAFMSLRLTSREIASRTGHLFATECFSERAFLLSDQESLSVLSEISKHEAFSKAMKRIILYPRRLRHVSIKLHRTQSRSERKAKRDLKRDYYKFLDTEKKHYHKTNLADTLVSILANFKQCGNLPDLSLAKEFPDAQSSPWPHGLAKFLNVTGCHRPLLGDHEKHHIALFVGIMTNHYMTQEMRFGFPTTGLPVGVFSQDYRATVGSPEFPCSNLRSLEIELDILMSYYPYDSDFVNSPARRRDILGFASFIAAAQNLRHLALGLTDLQTPNTARVHPDMSGLRADVFHSVATKTYLDGTPLELETQLQMLPRLSSIRLRNQQIDLQQLLTFLSERKATVSTVHLSHLVGKDPHLRREYVSGKIENAIDFKSFPDRNIHVSDTCYSGIGWHDLFHYDVWAMARNPKFITTTIQLD